MTQCDNNSKILVTPKLIARETNMMRSFSPIRNYRINHPRDTSSRSEVIIGIGAHKPKQPDDLNLSSNIESIESLTETITEKPPRLDKILVDLNNLPDESECAPYGCKMDIYVTVRHRPGCPHTKVREVNLGTKKFDFIGKGTYPYRQRDVEHSYVFDYGRKCEEFSDRCDQLLSEMSGRKSLKSKRLMKQGPFYQIIDEYSMVNTLIADRPVSRLYQRRNFTQSKVDLYALNVIETKY